MNFVVSLFRNAESTRPREVTWDLPTLLRELSTFAVRPDLEDKKFLPAWSPTRFSGPSRAIGNSAELSCLVIDMDGGGSLDQLWAAWDGRPRVLHTSWRHETAAPKARLVVPLARPVPADRWRSAWAWAARETLALGIVADRQCKGRNCIYFRPASPRVGSDRESRVESDGDLLDIRWEKLPDPDAVTRYRQQSRTVIVSNRDDRLPANRLDLAARIGAATRGEGQELRAVRVTCPGCGRPSVYFFIHPLRSYRAQCDHRRSCNWNGPISALEIR